MKRKMNPFIILMLILAFSAAQGQSDRRSSGTISKVGTTAGQFLKIGVGARSIGMGGAFVAIANDVSAMFWNPAGLSRINTHEATFTHTNWLVGTSYDFGAISLDMGSVGTFGAFISAFSTDNMAVRTVDQPDGTGEFFDVQDLAVGISYARNLTETFSIGGTIKYVYERLWHMSASAVAVDVGTLFQTPFWGVKLGASITNFGTQMRLDGRDIKFAYDPDLNNDGNVGVVNSEYEMQYYSLPLKFQVGLAKDITAGEDNRLTIAVDATHPNDNFESINTGFEYGWKEMVFLRGGYNSLLLDESEQGFTAGFGAMIRLAGTMMLRADYAYTDFGRLENAQRFTLSVKF